MSQPVSETALLVLDIQPVILGMLKNEELAKQVLDNSKKLVDFARKKGITIALVRVAFTEDEFSSIPPRNKSFGRFAQMGLTSPKQMGFHAEDESAQYHPILDVQPEDIQVRKNRPGPFTKTDLQQQLEKKNIHHLIISGVATSNAVLSAVRTALDLDYGMIVVKDACADPDQAMHDILVTNHFEKSCDVLTTDEVIARFN